MKRRHFLGFLFGGAVTAHQVAVNPAMLAKLMPAAEPLRLAPISLTHDVLASRIVADAGIMDLVSQHNALFRLLKAQGRVKPSEFADSVVISMEGQPESAMWFIPSE